MKKKLWKQWRFWMEVVLGLLLLFFILVTIGLSYEVDKINTILNDNGMTYNSKKEEIVFDEEDYDTDTDYSSEAVDDVTEESSTQESSTEPFNPDSYPIVDYNEWNHDKIDLFSKIKITGKVIQFLKDSSTINLRIAIDDNYDTIALVSINSDDYEDVIAEDDNVTIYGKNGGLTTYETTLKSEVTIPLLYGENYTINSYGN